MTAEALFSGPIVLTTGAEVGELTVVTASTESASASDCEMAATGVVTVIVDVVVRVPETV